MIGYLIDGRWIAPNAIEAVEYLKLTPQNTWVPAASIKEWNDLAENARAMKVYTMGGASFLAERPITCKRFDLDALMVETEPTPAGEVPPRQAPGAPVPKVEDPSVLKGVTLP